MPVGILIETKDSWVQSKGQGFRVREPGVELLLLPRTGYMDKALVT